MSALISERWLRLRGAAHSSDRTAADIDVNELRMCTQCCHGPINLPASPLFEIKQFNLTVFLLSFFFVNSSHALILLSVTEL